MTTPHITDEDAIAAYPAYWHDRVDHLLARVPSYMHGPFCRWVLWGIPPGDFLDAVIRSDLFQAVKKADDENLAAIPHWVKLFYNGSPAACFGSEKLSAQWVVKGGLLGKCEGCGGHLNVPGIAASARASIEGPKACVGCLDEYHARAPHEQEAEG